MNEDKIYEISKRNEKTAFEIIEKLQIIKIWKSFGATAKLVGSLKTGLMMKNKDIDFHIYSNSFSVSDSFTAISNFADNKNVNRIEYVNLLDKEDMCLEWHLWYKNINGEIWKIDMIHILKESKYAGYFERVAERIKSVLTPDYKNSILSIKNNIPENEHVMGIEIYQAVIRDGIKNYQKFSEWRKNNKPEGIIEWMP